MTKENLDKVHKHIIFIDLQSVTRTMAEEATKNIDAAIIAAEKKIRLSITLGVLNSDIKNEKLKAEALKILENALNKRSLGMFLFFMVCTNHTRTVGIDILSLPETVKEKFHVSLGTLVRDIQ